MNIEETKRLLTSFEKLSIAVVGDYCLDAYWLLDETNVEYSVETSKPTHAVCRQSYGLGGAGNVADNLAAIAVGRVCAFGVIGDDAFGREMVELMHRANIDTTGMVVQTDRWDTAVYAKPYVDLDEQERIDFGRFNDITDHTADELLATIDGKMNELDGLIINQQLRRGIHSECFITGLQQIVDRHAEKVILLDARDISDRYRHVICKLNAGEAARICGHQREIDHAVPVDELADYAKTIRRRTDRHVIITRGDRGILAYDGQNIFQVPGILTVDQIDPVGAGDTAASAVTAALAAKAPLHHAIELANYAANIVVRKLRQTGTAAADEILSFLADCDYVYRPDLAEDIRKADYWNNTEIEIVNHDARFAAVEHIILDHDGTVSTLRQGWEQIMEPVMVRAVLGEHYHDAPEELYHRVVKRVREYIEQSTGIETIVQMRALVRMVRQFRMVDDKDILDATGYKEIYNQALMDMVDKRIDKLSRGELTPAEFTVSGAPKLLKTLYDRGIKLYLASGTDHADLVREAEILGYADYFEGRIYGWAGQGTGSAKKKVIETILRENRLSGQALACIGDGPVELRLCKKACGLAIGVASDEIRRYGLNAIKRTRLIKAGADLLIPDYSQQDKLLELLFDT